MPTFETREQLSNYVTNVTLPEMEEYLREFSQEELVQALRDNVYNGNQGSYDNTYSLLSAVDSKSLESKSGLKTDIEITTLIDPKLMDYDYGSYYENGKEDNRENIVDWLNNGHGGFYKGYSINYTGRQFIEKAQKIINKTGKSRLSKYLKMIGYKIGK